ncbi:MAG TPA: ABC transporter ATP-binding protein [Blastocatellia bacterium]|nr:ABC transporter ATP-binding protein [Blastocatellia bacterium]
MNQSIPNQNGECLLEVRDLSTHFFTHRGEVPAVDHVSFDLKRGETLGLVGESGSGKSVTSLSIMRLIGQPGRIVGGQIIFKGQDLRKLSDEKMRQIRGNDIAMIFQDPMTSLNPVYTVGEQIAEAIRLHQKVGHHEARNRAIEMMKSVSIPDAAKRADNYPHQLSGGMRQRVMIAMAVCCNPELLIADEPTTALDVTTQAQILELLARLREEFKLALLLITHDLGVVAETADRVAVMYAGKIVEEAPTRELFKAPKHPYTEGLLRSVPRLSKEGVDRRNRLETIEGTVPNLLNLPPGCNFAPRCRYRIQECTTGEIPLLPVNENHQSRCIRLYEIGDEAARTDLAAQSK